MDVDKALSHKFSSEMVADDDKRLAIDSSSTWEHKELAKVRIRVLRGHTDAVQSCQFCAGDTRILTASWDKTVALWDAERGHVTKKYTGGHTMNISKARMNQEATRFVSAGWDKKLIVWDSETGAMLWTGHHGGMVTCCNFSHNGKLVVTGSDLDCTVRVWDSNTGQLVQELKDLHRSTITSCQFNPTDDRIFTSSMDYTSKVWDLKTNTNTITLGGHTNVVSDASCSQDERKFATVSWDKSIRVWDISTGAFRSRGSSHIEKAHEGCVSSCDFSRDGSLLVTGGYDLPGDHQVVLWDMDNMVRKLRLQGHTDWVEDVAFSHDQKWIVSASKDKTVRLWNIENADNIPMVIETKKAIGHRLLSCSQCGKSFSAVKTDSDSEDAGKLCVFCRLQASDRRTSATPVECHKSA